MKAIIVDNPGPDASLTWQEVDDAVPAQGEILIRVAAAGVNRADLMQRVGRYPPPTAASPYLGLECAGEVVALGSEVTRFQVGDPVCALLSGGGYAELVAVPEGQALPVPLGLSVHDAAGIPEVFATAFANLYMEAAAVPGERFLIHAGGSGVGTAAIGLAKIKNNPCFVTVGGEEKARRCLELGASGASDRLEGSFVDKVSEWAEGQGVDVVLDPVGASYFNDNLAVLSMDGRLVLIGVMGGHKIESSLLPMMGKRLRIIGSTLRNRSTEYKSAVMARLEREVWPSFDSGALRAQVDASYPIERADEAHAHMQSDANFGKILLEV